jgi:glycosyltransferase involved in cell wall biosynthesis
MKRRLVVITELIAPYRIPVFNALMQRPDVDLQVIFLSRTDSSMRDWRIYEEEIRFSYEVLPCWRKRVGKYNVLLNRGLMSALRLASPDAIVCGGYNYLSSWQALRWAKRNRVPFVLWSESTSNDHRYNRTLVELLKRKFLESCDAFVVPGKSARQYLEQFDVPPAKIFTAPNAVDTVLFSAAQSRAQQPSTRLRSRLALPDKYYLFVGRLVRAKGVLDLLEAYALLAPELRERFSVVFAGDGPMRSELEARAREIYPGTIHFAGFVHRDDLPAYYALADCLVFPTHSDTWGMVVNEAMTSGLPVICTRVAGCAADLIRDNGRLVSAGNLGELALAMEEIARDPDLRGRMACESRELIRSFSPENCAAGLAQASSAMEAHVR